jgi:phage/plasmid-like protein (TIGR03299 family)
MAHQVDKMFSVREVPWHFGETGKDGRSTILQEYPETWAEARVPAGLEWDPIQETPYRHVVTVGEDGIPAESYEPVSGFNLITRSDTGLVLAASPESLEMITNTDMGLIIETMLAGQKLRFETGGSLDEGRKVWALMALGDPIEIKGDPSATQRYLALLNSHDGHGACKAIATNVRVVCANTWHYADTEAEGKGACFSFHHRSQWRERMKELQDDVRAALSGANKEVEAYRELAEDMLAMPVTLEQELRFVDEFVYPTRKEHELKPQALENVKAARNMVYGNLESVTSEGIRGTAYGLMQAGGEWLDHGRRYKNSETYLNRTLFTSEEMKLRAKNIAVLAHQGAL